MLQKNYFAIKAITYVSLFFSSGFSYAALYKVKESSVSAPLHLGKIALYHSEENGFEVQHKGKNYRVEKYWSDQLLRNITSKQLQAFADKGYISINQMDNNEFSLTARGRLVGGGPLFGTIAYFLTKTLCYGTAVAAASGVAVTGGGALGAATGALAAASTLSAPAGVAVAGGAIAGAGLGAKATILAGAAIAAGGGVASTVAAIESAAVAAGMFFTAIPFLP